MKQKNNKNPKNQLAEQDIKHFDQKLKSPKKWSESLFYFINNPAPFLMIWVSLILMYGVVCAYPNEMGQDEFYRFIFFLKNPMVVLINILALCVALIHTFSYCCQLFKASLTLGKNKLFSIFVIIGFSMLIIGVSSVLLIMVLR